MSKYGVIMMAKCNAEIQSHDDGKMKAEMWSHDDSKMNVE